MPYSESGVGSRESEVRSVSIDGVVASEIIVPANAQEAAEALADSG